MPLTEIAGADAAGRSAARLGQRLSPAGGVEITGADLSAPLAPALKAMILQAFLDHHIVVVRDQALTQDQQYDFTVNFGELEEHVGRHSDGRYGIVHSVTNLDRDGNPTDALDTRGNYFWHTDKSYHAVPSLMTMLHAVELPPDGGDTQFANMALAYRALPAAMKERLAGLRGIHSWQASRTASGSRPATEAELRERPPVDHPVVRTHPETGEKALYLGNHAATIVGMDEAEGATLLTDLLAHATQSEFVYTHRWRQGDLILWDNRCLLHRAVANYAMGMHRRVLHRTVVRGTVPY
ncbi:MAG TPA: TauD/TfdA family dioxygenase [Stellaceae bacterium]|jgi:taurine dioxygenase|nr:TauD/TfdA family dioxygenase [Stellaceae bacterium]